jgi:hypothetical protein
LVHLSLLMAARTGSDGHRRLPEQGSPPDSGLPWDVVQAAAVLLITGLRGKSLII